MSSHSAFLFAFLPALGAVALAFFKRAQIARSGAITWESAFTGLSATALFVFSIASYVYGPKVGFLTEAQASGVGLGALLGVLIGSIAGSVLVDKATPN